MNRKRAVIVHGWAGTPEKHWFPWLKAELERAGWQVSVPAMPDTKHPEFSAWKECLEETVGAPDGELYLVGHSLGVMTILRYLETFPAGVRVGGAVLVAGFPENIGRDEIARFFGEPLRYDRVKDRARKFAVIASDDDPYVPMRHGEALRDGLGAELVTIHAGGHLDADAGFTELPAALEALKRMGG